MDSAHHMGKEIGQLEKDLGMAPELDNPYNFLEVGKRVVERNPAILIIY